jgi:hypothetical protein
MARAVGGIDSERDIFDGADFRIRKAQPLSLRSPPLLILTAASFFHGLVLGGRVEYRALERFVLQVLPFNFTAIGGNLPGVPALVGNVVSWNPLPAATYSNYFVYQLLEEAGVPPGAI